MKWFILNHVFFCRICKNIRILQQSKSNFSAEKTMKQYKSLFDYSGMRKYVETTHQLQFSSQLSAFTILVKAKF